MEPRTRDERTASRGRAARSAWTELGAALALIAGILLPAPATAEAPLSRVLDVACEGDAALDVADAYAFVLANRKPISLLWEREQVPAMKDAPLRQRLVSASSEVRKRFLDAWRGYRVVVVCGPCSARGDTFGQVLPGGGVMVCYVRHVSASTGFCELVDTLVHESIHQIGLPGGDTHNLFQDRASDPVYRFGWAAGGLCRDAGFERPLRGNAG